MPTFAALIVAAGRGERAGGEHPKQFRSLGGASLLRRSAELFAERSDVSLVLVVVGKGQDTDARDELRGLDVLPLVLGGETRQASVRKGLEALAPKAPDFVLIHDAARPFASPAILDRVMSALSNGADCAVPLLPVIDTLKHEREPHIWTTVPRNGLMRAQTPQGFRFEKILSSHISHASVDVTDDMALAERSGMTIAAVAGEEVNMKITTAEDFAFAERLLSGGSEFRTGFGFDVHGFVPGDHVWLCGIRIPHDKGLEGHSDADTGLHALTDAVLGAIGAGDIGEHFPSHDPRWNGAPSSKFLVHAMEMLKQAKGRIVNADVTLICELPKISPHRDAMRTRIAEILGVDRSRISVKATTTDRLGFTGRGEGLAAQAVATIRMPT